MSEADVEKTLKEIRERVRVQIRDQGPASISPHETTQKRANAAAIESLRANLSVIERSRNRFPPLVSYRTGWVARMELWCKRLLKRASHWFTWEQINFNSATSNSLKDVMAVLSSHEEVLNELESQLQKIALVTRRIQVQLDVLPANGHLIGDSTGADSVKSEVLRADLMPENRGVTREQSSALDAEICDLAERLEELRAVKARLEGLS